MEQVGAGGIYTAAEAAHHIKALHSPPKKMAAQAIEIVRKSFLTSAS
jgi:hypothetical protein